MSKGALQKLEEDLSEFARERDWEQFHSPKNLAMVLSGEVGELIAEFQWLTSEESKKVMASDSAQQVRIEIADVFIYLVRLADILDIDLFEVASEKISMNAEKYPS